ncbi:MULTISPECIES: DUF3861 domain-containing protein [Photobacterium]|jgi:hypothetical protein|uniref:DUF3861 domain-containing protein n=1 Tax=Photobacterium iliopiscarium TaxID=56192 RepID=A0A0D8P679_9GAMM|nr:MULTISPECIES: DUF3861 domain-containing protein [Photobacterium]KJG14283.1 hypothetical protein UB38_04175 [Photobacterium iliopiscarium]KJG20494.1 hypothetical protein UB37_14260 [Photobacterium iliopiscarium]MCD9530527.1 DUF3861 family protein [Photobacterium carnosum]MCF2154224.1 DUF3861 family protein [Photobacterium carnosum]MCF2216000.1 DUF3861 family protein [Photobacterium carnosum]
MPNKKTYRITIEEVESPSSTAQTMQFEFQDREDLFKIVKNLKEGCELDATQATRVGVALRLLGPVMVMNRKHPLFADFMPHFKTFMQSLKNTVKQSLIDK